jgi:hypothetical protein
MSLGWSCGWTRLSGTDRNAMMMNDMATTTTMTYSRLRMISHCFPCLMFDFTYYLCTINSEVLCLLVRALSYCHYDSCL